jgi:hypothetical protein
MPLSVFVVEIVRVMAPPQRCCDQVPARRYKRRVGAPRRGRGGSIISRRQSKRKAAPGVLLSVWPSRFRRMARRPPPARWSPPAVARRGALIVADHHLGEHAPRINEM